MCMVNEYMYVGSYVFVKSSISEIEMWGVLIF